MARRGKFLGLALALLAVFLGSASPVNHSLRQAQAAPSNKALKTKIYQLYQQLVGDDPKQAFMAQLELEAIGADLADYAFEQINKLDSDAGFISAFILGEVRDPAVVDRMLEILRNSKFLGHGGTEDFDIQAEGARNMRDGLLCVSLALQGNRMADEDAKLKEITQQLRTYILPDNPRVAFVKTCAVLGLGLVGDQESISDFCDIALDFNEQNPIFLRVAAVLSLMYFPGDKSRETLEDLAGREPKDENDWRENFLQKNAVLGLGNVGTKNSKDILMRAVVNPNSPGVRRHAWVAIGELKIEEALSKLQEVYASETEVHVQVAAARCFYQLGDPDTCYAIMERIFSGKNVADGDLQDAAEVLSSIKDNRSKELCIKLLTKGRQTVKSAAAANLAKYASQDDVRPIIMKLASGKGGDEFVREQAVLGLSYIPELDDEALAVLSKTIKASEMLSRCSVVALGNRTTSDERVKALLKTAMGDSELVVQGFAAMGYASNYLRDEDTAGLLKALTAKSNSFFVRDMCNLGINATETKDNKDLKTQWSRERDRLSQLGPDQNLLSIYMSRQMQMALETAMKDSLTPNGGEETEISETQVQGGCTPG